MITFTKPIATPKKGKASGDSSSRSAHTGRPMAIQVHGVNVDLSNMGVTQKVAGVRSADRRELIKVIRAGFKYRAIEKLSNALGSSQKEISQLLSIPTSTLNRRKKEGRLHADESDRVIRFATLKDQALTLMQGDEEAALAWLRAPLPILGDETPLEHATTELGAKEVEDLVGRLRHGVFS